MICVTVDIRPFGNEGEKREAYQIIIVNDTTGTSLRGNYIYRITKLGLHKLPWRRGEVKNFPRKRKDVLHLLKQVIDNALEEKDIEG